MSDKVKKQPIYYEAERIFSDWFSGGNCRGIQGFDMMEDQLNMMLLYIKCLEPEAIKPALDSLLTSPYLVAYLKKQKKKQLYFPNCIPTILFLEVTFPYVEEYEEIVRIHDLKRFILCDKTNTPLTDCFSHSSGGFPVYLCCVRIGAIGIVNMLPAIPPRNGTTPFNNGNRVDEKQEKK
jgi:hypothetical protein